MSLPPLVTRTFANVVIVVCLLLPVPFADAQQAAVPAAVLTPAQGVTPRAWQTSGPAVAQQAATEVFEATEAAAEAAPTPDAATTGLSPEQQAEAERNAQEAKEKAEAEARKQKRLQEINQLRFDRRRSIILKTWAAPEDDAREDEESSNRQVAETTSEAKGEDVTDETRNSETPEGELTEAQQKAKRIADEEKAFASQLKQLQRAVTLSDWKIVEQVLNEHFDPEFGTAAYKRMLQSLAQGPQMGQPRSGNRALQQYQEQNVFQIADLLALANVSPTALERDQVNLLGNILAQLLRQGTVLSEFVKTVEQQFAADADSKLTRRDVARMLIVAGGALEVEPFLPAWETAAEQEDHEALNLLSQLFLARYAKDKESDQLEKAWMVTQAILAAKEIKNEEKLEALTRAVDLASRVREQLGQTWLEESFTKRPERGMEIIAAIGGGASQALVDRAFDAESRLRSLQLQTAAVEALLRAAPDRATQWRDHVSLLADNWRTEANYSYEHDTSSAIGPQMQRDAYGNFFYFDHAAMNRQQRQNQPLPIKTGELLEIRPSDEWLSLVHVGLKPSFDMTVGKLYLKVGEEAAAFPFIESLAASHPKLAKELVDEFIRVWTTNHDPNANRNRTNYYVYMYGYERKAEGIPLTRSKQQRNLEELADWVARLQTLPVELDEKLISRAFSTCHSSAEVYQLEAIERVFGPIDDIDPETLAELAQQMRSNLMGVWRAPAVQQQAKTNRKKKDIETEVLRGYQVARAVVDDALAKYPESWALQLARAAINHDENNYRAELEKDSQFSRRRAEAFAEFEAAAKAYVTTAKDLKQEDETTQAFETWYYASLGACDLSHLDEETQVAPRQPDKIRECLLSMPAEQAERHIAMFANTLFTRMSSVKPAAKFGYLKNGFEIVGDHKLAHEARKVFDYYNDLVTEIKLETEIDGTDVVGHETPFGLFVNIVHTREIERESGGFAKYLQNQNNGMFYYNYGRPTENYRDRFEEMVTETLAEHFDILSITFQAETVNSRALAKYGWRVTPYAYLLLKARGPEVDQIPSLRLDLDFLDTSGYAVLPVESPIIPVDAKAAQGDPRPVRKLSIVQTLDERQAEDGKLILEVQATGQGLVPNLESVLDLDPDEFEIADVEDQGLSVSRFDPEAEDNLVISERTWLATLLARADLSEHPKAFQFAATLPEMANLVTETTFQRYVDADLESVEPVIELQQQYGQPRRPWLGWMLGGILALLAFGIFVVIRRPGNSTAAEKRFVMPEQITPFTVLGLLRDIQQNNGFDERKRGELGESIARIERFYFQERDQANEPDLQTIAESWLTRVPH